jgi:hypothetical protein
MYLQTVESKKLRKKYLFFVGIFRVTDEKSRIRIRIRKPVVRIRETGSLPYQNDTDPQLLVLASYLFFLLGAGGGAARLADAGLLLQAHAQDWAG